MKRYNDWKEAKITSKVEYFENLTYDISPLPQQGDDLCITYHYAVTVPRIQYYSAV